MDFFRVVFIPKSQGYFVVSHIALSRFFDFEFDLKVFLAHFIFNELASFFGAKGNFDFGCVRRSCACLQGCFFVVVNDFHIGQELIEGQEIRLDVLVVAEVEHPRVEGFIHELGRVLEVVDY